MRTPIQCTLLDLVQQVNEATENDNEAVATIAYLINSGRVRLCGTFAGAKIQLSLPNATARLRTMKPT